MDEQKKSEANIGAMRKRRVTMADGQRYLICYTFGEDAETTENESEILPEDADEKSEETQL